MGRIVHFFPVGTVNNGNNEENTLSTGEFYKGVVKKRKFESVTVWVSLVGPGPILGTRLADTHWLGPRPPPSPK